jgi:branched-chain amino acid aminotransferase
MGMLHGEGPHFSFLCAQIRKMVESMTPIVRRAAVSKLGELTLENLPFGKHFSDHMLVADYADGAWGRPEIRPYGPMEMPPSMSAIHYGQSIFEGMKAFRTPGGGISVFRPAQNLERFNRSAARMEMPQVPASLFIEGLRELIRVDEAWVPDYPDHSLYLRPFMFATDPYLGVRPSETYRFAIILSPSGPFFLEPQRIHVEEHFVRAVEGGVGYAKTAGNYGASMHATALARARGFDQVLWTDPFAHRYVQEIGMMNVLFRIGGTVVTPGLEAGTILPGVTRSSLITLLRDWGVPVEERPVGMDELLDAYGRGALQEVFGAGTAASVSMIRELSYAGGAMTFDVAAFDLARRLRDTLKGIQRGALPDVHGWLMPV